jgi:hypothetical protein
MQQAGAIMQQAVQVKGKRHIVAVVVVAAVLLLLSGSLFGYFMVHGMATAQSYEKGLPSLPQHVLIATQGSTFKDRLVTAVVAQLEQRPAYVKVIDVGRLGDIDGGDWQAIVIVHSWEFGKPPAVVRDFVARLADPGKVIDVTTSGGGREKLPGVDVISSASVIDEVPQLAAQIYSKIDSRLASPGHMPATAPGF